MSELNLNFLNDEAKKNPEELILRAEDKYTRIIKTLAKRILENEKIRIVLLAGPSGSGKTTSANLLRDELLANGRESIVISLDDFYREHSDEGYPRLENGEMDFEAFDALDVPLLQNMLLKVSLGEGFEIPKYDFKTGKRKEGKSHAPMPNGTVIIEGLHALNPRVFSLLPKERLLKIFISVSTNINNEGGRILSGRKIRFVRRLVRDSIYRNADATRTLALWKNVLLGEDTYLYPFKDNADVFFDTFHEFELSVMRPFVLKLISSELANSDAYAKTVKDALSSVVPIDLNLLPDTSLIREFVPGGIYENIY